MLPIPLIHRSALVPAVGMLSDIGAPVGELLRQNRLPTLGYDKPRGFVPVLDTWGFIDSAAASQGIWDFGFRVAERVKLHRAARWGPRVAAAPTLGSAIEIMSRTVRDDMPNVYFGIERRGLERRGEELWLWREHRPDRRRARGFWVGEQYILALMIQLVRMAEGGDWVPRRVDISANACDWRGQRPDIAGDARIRFGAARTALELPAGSLARHLTGAQSAGDWSSRLTDELPARDLKGSLRQAIKQLACEDPLSIQLAAGMLHTSERSLRRHLAAEGTSWRELVDRVRLETTLELIEDPAISLRDIAGSLGYSQYPHFNRAFHRWTGQSPGEYRRSLPRSAPSSRSD